MVRIDTPSKASRLRNAETTQEGAPARSEDPIERLRRIINAHLLWEDGFYVDGKGAAEALIKAVNEAFVYDFFSTASLIVDARHKMHIRHASLLAAVAYARANVKHNSKVGSTTQAVVDGVIQRADELAEILALNAHLSGDAKKMPHALKKGVANAFNRFDEYQLAKYDRPDPIRLRDAIRLTHPRDPDGLLKKVIEGTLTPADTWERGLSTGGDKREVFTRLLREKRLGSLALLRNLRNLSQAGVDRDLVAEAMREANWSKVFPFNFVAAAKAALDFASELDEAFFEAKAAQHTLGSANVLIDASASMDVPLSARSSLTRREAAAALGLCWPGKVNMFVFGTHCQRVPAFLSLGTVLQYDNHGVGHGTNIGSAVRTANRSCPDVRFTVVLTDCQSHDVVGEPAGRGVMINTGADSNGVATDGDWLHLSGFSEGVYRYLETGA